MARATWSGFLSFGLVSVPVGLFSATSDQTIHFNQLHNRSEHVEEAILLLGLATVVLVARAETSRI